MSISAIARRTGRDPKTVRKYIERGLEPPAYGPRQAGRPSKLAPKFSIIVWPLAVQRADQRQNEDFVPELHHGSRKLEQLLCLALDDVIAALLVDFGCIESERPSPSRHLVIVQVRLASR